MVNDELGLLFRSAALTVAVNTALTSNGNDLNIGRGGLPSPAQVVAYVGKVDASRDLVFNYYLSLNNSSFRLIAAITMPAGYKGKRTAMVGESLDWKQWDDTKIMLRCSITAANNANSANWGAVSSYLGAGEETVVGRKANAAETLMDA